jgi:hypothetical protein
MDARKLQAWWWHKQGLDGGCAGWAPAAVLERSGWARSVGGAGPYLTLFARAGASREEVDAAVARLEIHELPSARGCTYVLPASDFGLGLKVGLAFAGADMKTAEKLGVTQAEIDRLCEAVLAALEGGPLEPDELKGAARNLGPEGKKKGLATTLPVALGRLQAEGRIRRIPTTGRLDQQRYRYTLWQPPAMPQNAYEELARRFFRWIGPATIAEFQWFSGLSGKAARAAVAPLGLAGLDGDWMILPEERDAFEAFACPGEPQYALVSSLDAISALRRDVKGLVDEEDLERQVFGDKALGGLTDLPNHVILDRGRVIGLWEYDVDTESIVWWSFRAADKALRQAVARTEEFVRTRLGDARSFSLDSPKSRAPRIAGLRAAGVYTAQ